MQVILSPKPCRAQRLRTVGPARCQRPQQACRRIAPVGACRQSARQFQPGRPNAQHVSLNRSRRDRADRRRACDSHRVCRCRPRPVGSNRRYYGANSPSKASTNPGASHLDRQRCARGGLSFWNDLTGIRRSDRHGRSLRPDQLSLGLKSCQQTHC